MSNKIVPSVYRTVIDQVISSVRLDFDELAVDEEILALLQQKWESKLLASHVAEFEPSPVQQLQSHHPMHVPVPSSGQYRYQQQLKNEQYSQQQGGAGPSNGGARPYPAAPNGQQQPNGGNQQWNGGLRGGADGGADGAMRLRGGNGEEEEEEGDDSDSSSTASSSHKPAAATTSAPAPPTVPAVPYVPNEHGIFPGDEKIDSDLDDSEDDGDDEDEDGAGGEDANMDIVFCVYDKVQRVKNKWKMVFRDGMGHVNGKDYLFSKCSSDFEW